MMVGEDVCGPFSGPNPHSQSAYHADRHSGPEMGISSSSSSMLSGNNLVELEGPRHSRFRAFQTRLNSFRDWPNAMPQKPKDLAEAGFFYLGRGDRVQCFYCDGGLKNWDPEDDPWEEHARWFGECAHLRLVKGQEFVEEVMKKAGAEEEDYLEEDLEDLDTQVDQQAEAASLAANEVPPTTHQDMTAVKKKQKSGGSSPGQESGYSSLELEYENEEETKEQSHLQRENQRLREEKLCKICADCEVGVVFVPCGHFATCVNCAPSFSECPVCRTKIQSAVRTFLS